MANKKKMAMTLGAMALTAVIAIGGTLAYMSQITGTKENKFTSAKNVDGTIEETEWETNHPNGWTDYQPGQATAKDPKIKLESGSENAWAAIRLDFLDASLKTLDYDRFSKYATYDKINEKWKIIAKNDDGSELYMYSDEVTPEAPTTALFNEIKVSAGITTVHSSTITKYFKRIVEKDEDGKITRDEVIEVGKEEVKGEDAFFDEDGNPVGVGNKLPEFRINATGYAVQVTEVNYEMAKVELIKLANTGVSEASSSYFKAV